MHSAFRLIWFVVKSGRRSLADRTASNCDSIRASTTRQKHVTEIAELRNRSMGQVIVVFVAIMFGDAVYGW